MTYTPGGIQTMSFVAGAANAAGTSANKPDKAPVRINLECSVQAFMFFDSFLKKELHLEAELAEGQQSMTEANNGCFEDEWFS
jgi:hypothetical protein